MARNKHFHSKREEEDRNKRSDQVRAKAAGKMPTPSPEYYSVTKGSRAHVALSELPQT